MRVRDAVEADAESMAELTDSPLDVMANLVHDRTVRVAVESDEDATATHGEDRLLGFVSFDARGQTLHITQLAGSESACKRLLEEPIRFARQEAMVVELLVPDDESAVRTAARAMAFTEHGTGPRFSGRQTIRYRLEPAQDG